MGKLWYVEISGHSNGVITVDKYYADAVLHSFVDGDGFLHKRYNVSNAFDLDSIGCKNMVFDYMEENGGLDNYGMHLSDCKLKGVDWVDNSNREYNLMYGRRGNLSVVYTDSKNINNLLQIKEGNKKKDIPTNQFEYGLKRYIKSVRKTVKKIKNKESIDLVNGVKY